jgi:hypothetical protein
MIERRWEARKRYPGCPYLFHRGGKKVGSFRRSFRTACLAAGIVPGRAGKTIHDFRRTGVANLIDSGCDERTAMLVSGHKTLSMLARYNIRRREAVRQALQRVEEYVAAMPVVGTVELLNEERGSEDALRPPGRRTDPRVRKPGLGSREAARSSGPHPDLLDKTRER